MLWILAVLAVAGGSYGVLVFGFSRSLLFLGQLCKGKVPFSVRASATFGVVGSACMIGGGIMLPFAQDYNDCLVLFLGIAVAAISGISYLMSMRSWTKEIEKELKTSCPIKPATEN